MKGLLCPLLLKHLYPFFNHPINQKEVYVCPQSLIIWWAKPKPPFVEGSFFTPHGITSLPTHATPINILLIFWVNLFKAQKNLYLIQLHELGSHGPQHLQHQYMDWAQVMNLNSRPILPLSYLWKVASPTKAHIYTKWQQSPKAHIYKKWQQSSRYVISSSAYDPSSWASLGKLWELWFVGSKGMFNKTLAI